MLQQCILKNQCLLAKQVQQFHRRLSQQLELAVIGVAPTIESVLSELITAKTNGNKRANYLKSVSFYVKQFAAGREQRPLDEFTTAEIEQWMMQYPKPWTRATWLSRLSGLFAFAVRRGHLSVNPCARIERVSVDKCPPKILTPEQAETLLRTTKNLYKPYLILALYAGVRPEEIERMDWEDVNLETKTVRVKGKTRQQRIVTLEPKALDLLAKCALRKGPVTPHHSSLVRYKKSVRKILGFDRFPQDLFRHTAASYLLAIHKDAGKVSTMLGNSASILLTHYHDPVTQSDQVRFWAVQSHTKYDQGGLATPKSSKQLFTGGQTDSQDKPKSDASAQASRAGKSQAGRPVDE